MRETRVDGRPWMLSRWGKWYTAIWAVLIAGPGLMAQNASLSGRVVDPAGAVVPMAAVSLTRLGTGAKSVAESNSEGLYSFPFASPGQYRLEVTADGFKKFEQTSITIQTGQRAAVDIRLELGATTESVTVEANVASINTVDAARGNAFGTSSILQLPLEGRNVAGLLSLQAGVASISDDPHSRDIRNGAVNGAQTTQSNVTLDGVDVNDQDTKLPLTSALRTTLDAVQEFRVVTTNANADMGRSSGAQVSLITKSGTNDFHGSLYEFHRNSATAANDFFNNRADVKKPKLIRNVFGGSLGGPIVRNRAFFFYNYEGRRDASESTETRVVPLQSFRNGTVRYLNTSGGISELTPAYIRGQLDPLGIGPNSAVLDYMRQYPLPNDTSEGDGINTGGYRFTSPTPLSWNTSIARVDWNLGASGAHQMFLRGNLQADTQKNAPQFPGQPPNSVLTGNNKGLAFGYTASLTPGLVSTFRYGFTRVGSNSAGVRTGSRADVYIGGDPFFGDTTSLAKVMPVHTIVEDMSLTRGSHTFQFGGVFRSIRNRRTNNDNSFHQVWADSNSLLDGNTLTVPDLSSLWVQPFEGSIMSMLGIQNFGEAHYNYDIEGSLLTEGSPVRRTFGMEELEFYAQDTWRISRALTMTAGVRWSLMPPVHEVNGAQVSLLPGYTEFVDKRVALADAGLPSRDAGLVSFVPRDSAQGQPLYPFHKNNIAPRLSLAYSPQASDGWMAKLFGGPGRTSIRAGAGIYYDLFGMELMERLDRNAFGLSSVISSMPLGYSLSTAPRFTGYANIPAGILPEPPPGGPGTPPEAFGDAHVVDSSLRAPYSINLSFSIARELGGGFVIEGAYVGRLGKRTLVTENSAANQVDFRDPASGQRLFESLRQLETQVRSKTPIDQIRPIAFWENMYPDAASNGLTATQAVYDVVRTYSPDPTSALYGLDIECIPSCSKLGPYTFFTPQYWRLEAARSVGFTDYHSMQLSVRKRFSQGFQFDLNYTLSKSIDLVSTWGGYTTGIEGYSSWTITNPWDRRSQRAVSDFDMRHQWNANWVAELPFGKGKRYLNSAGGVTGAALGGWQVSGLWRLTSGLPISVLNTRGWPNGWCCPHYAEPIAPVPAQTNNKNAPLIGGSSGPNLFDNPAAALAAFDSANVGPTSNRNNLRGQGVFTIDLGLGKTFPLPFEGHRLQVRAEAFNLTNSVRFKPDLFGTVALQTPGSFGNYNTVMTPARVMQFGMRYEF